MKEEERTLQAQVLGLRWQKLKANAERARRSKSIILRPNCRPRFQDQRRLEAEIVTKRADAQQVIDQSSEVQRQFMIWVRKSRASRKASVSIRARSVLNEDIKAGEEELGETRARLTTDQSELSRLTSERQGARSTNSGGHCRSSRASSEALATAEQALRAAERDWEYLLRAQSEARQAGEIAQSKISMLEDSIGRLAGRINQLKTDQSQLEQQSAEQELKPLEAMLETQQAQVQRIESELENYYK